MSAAVCELPVDYVFSCQDHDALHRELSKLTVSPYKFYEPFLRQVRQLRACGRVPSSFLEFCSSLADRNRDQAPTVVIRNAPIDVDVPPFDPDEPVKSKYDIKKTFVAEGVLALLGLCCATPAIGYLNVNDGDVFQDIYPKRSMWTTQSQKALKEIYFHKDLANHFVRPDHVYMLGMRSSPANEVYTSFTRNIEVIAQFGGQERALLRQRVFHTPFDDLTLRTGNVAVGQADNHPILSGTTDLRYFEHRTTGLTSEADLLVKQVSAALHEHKKRVSIEPGDMVGVFNNHALHAKEVVSVADEAALRTRWIIKTVNGHSVEPHREHLVEGTDDLVNG